MGGRHAGSERRGKRNGGRSDSPPTPQSGYGAARPARSRGRVRRIRLARHLLPGGVEARKRQRNEVKGEPAATPLARERGAASPRWRRTVGGKVFRPPPLAAPAACDVRFVTGGTRRARERATCRRHLGLAGTIRTAVTRRQGKRAGRPRSQATLPHADRETRRRNGGFHH